MFQVVIVVVCAKKTFLVYASASSVCMRRDQLIYPELKKWSDWQVLRWKDNLKCFGNRCKTTNRPQQLQDPRLSVFLWIALMYLDW